ncbi:hypothetical protein [Chitinophaga sp.]
MHLPAAPVNAADYSKRSLVKEYRQSSTNTGFPANDQLSMC